MNEYIGSAIWIFFGTSIILASWEHFSFGVWKRYREDCLVVLCIGLIIVTGFIDGMDKDAYKDIFRQIPSLWELMNGKISIIFDIPVEFGFIFVNSIVKFLFDEPVFVFILMPFISIVCYYLTFKYLSPLPCLSFISYFSLLYIFKEAVQIRHGLACALVVYSLNFVYKQQFKRFLGVIMCSMLFHLATSFAIGLYWINKIQWTHRRILCIIFFSLIIINVNWIYVVLSILSDNGLLFYRIAAYQGNEVAQAEVSIVKYLSYLGILFIFSMCRPKLEQYSLIYNLLLGMMAIGVLIQGIFFEFKEMADRLSICFYTAEFFLIPLLTKIPKWGNFIFFILLIFFFLFFYRTWLWLTNPIAM